MISEERAWILWGETDYNVEAFARAVEAEARKMALEEAISECSDMIDNSDGSHGWNRACKRCAAAIRALKEKP